MVTPARRCPSACPIRLAAMSACLLLSPACRASADEVEKRFQAHGYIDAHYNNPVLGTMNSSAPNVAEVHRLAVGFTYEFTSTIRGEAEIDFEHNAQDLELEYAYVECDLASAVALRAGAMLMPMGPLNETHEPVGYYSVERAYIERSLIPTTWSEFGVGLAGRAVKGALGYRAYLVTGLNATGFTTQNGIRGGRAFLAEDAANELAGVARGEYSPTPGLTAGASVYYGGANQGAPGLGSAAVSILSLDARYRRAGFDLRGLAAGIGVDDADSVSAVTGQTIGSSMSGWSLEAAYDVLHRGTADGGAGGGSGGGRALYLFARYEDFNTNAEVPSGYTADPEADRQIFTTGVSYLPIDKVAFKSDFEFWQDGSDDKLTRFNLGVALQF